MYFIANEAIANVLKHAGARVASIHVARVAANVRVTVHDDGAGGADPALGTGILGIRARVHAVDGSFSITSPVGGPTTLVLRSPVTWRSIVADVADASAAALRTVIADDSVLLRDGLVRLLTDSGFDVVAAVGDADTLLDAVTEHSPDLCLVDVRMPPTHTDEGLRAAIEIRRRHPDIAVLVLSQYVEERYAAAVSADDLERRGERRAHPFAGGGGRAT